MTGLMTPRVILINYYPNSPFEVGDVLHYVNGKNGAPDFYTMYGKPSILLIPEVERATANFRILSWWEKLDVKDMPEYVALPWGDGFAYVHKVEKWEGANYKGEPLYYYYNNKNELTTTSVSSKIPATITDYENYLKCKST